MDFVRRLRRQFIRLQPLSTVLTALWLWPLAASAELAPLPPGVSLHWPERVYGWRYNAANEPDWLARGEVLAMIRAAARAWEACGVALPFLGESDKTPGAIDGANVIGWSNDGKAYSAWTSWRARRSGQLIEADIALYGNVFSNYRERGIDARLELRKSIVHEFGHVLGLTHSTQWGDAMIVKRLTRPEWRLPSDNDIGRCRALYP